MFVQAGSEMALPFVAIDYQWLLSIESCEWFLKYQDVLWICCTIDMSTKIEDGGKIYGLLILFLYCRLLILSKINDLRNI
jgi:hypothetical protein